MSWKKQLSTGWGGYGMIYGTVLETDGTPRVGIQVSSDLPKTTISLAWGFCMGHVAGRDFVLSASGAEDCPGVDVWGDELTFVCLCPAGTNEPDPEPATIALALAPVVPPRVQGTVYPSTSVLSLWKNGTKDPLFMGSVSGSPYAFNNLLAGVNYTLTCAKDNYTTQMYSFTPSVSQQVVKNFVLQMSGK